MGLHFMRERAHALGGALRIESSDHGTRLRFQLLGAGDATAHLPATPAADLDNPRSAGATMRVFVAERHPLMRAGLSSLIEAGVDLRVVGEASTSSEVRAQVGRSRPDVVVLDSHLAGGELEALIRRIRAELPMSGILVMSDGVAGREPELIDAGAAGCVSKFADSGELTDRLRAAMREARSLEPELSPTSDDGALTGRERAILILVTAGKTNAEIGETLFLAIKTVERQVATIVRKLGARNRAHAAALAVARNIVDPEAADD
jgi:two-component system NarL family response regulator